MAVPQDEIARAVETVKLAVSQMDPVAYQDLAKEIFPRLFRKPKPA